jgi:mannose-6-phosphate isomerase-like protein (cupin superfamily)
MTLDARDPLPGAVGVTHLAVYDSTAPDGELGGSPHVHLACTEAYVVQAGRGRVQTLGADGYQEVAVEPLDVVWFTPGVIHRLVNDGGLEILVIMQNEGLPEAGDAILAFPPEVLADAEAYARAAAVGDDPAQRRDLAVRGFIELRKRVEAEGPAALEPFWAAALALVAPHLAEWEERWRRGPLAAAQHTGEILAALRAGDTGTLAEAHVQHTRAHDDPRATGMCGRLATVDVRTAISA